MKRTTVFLTTRALGALTAAAMLAAFAPANAHAGDDSTAAKHARHHESARLRHARHVHYISEPQHKAIEVVPVRVNGNKPDDAPLDESLYRSFQEQNLVNPG